MSRYQLNPSDDHWVAVKNILKYLRKTKDVFLVYGDGDLIVSRYIDVSFQSNKDNSKSQSSYLFTMNGGTVGWKSFK